MKFMAIGHLGLDLFGRGPFESSAIGVQCNVMYLAAQFLTITQLFWWKSIHKDSDDHVNLMGMHMRICDKKAYVINSG